MSLFNKDRESRKQFSDYIRIKILIWMILLILKNEYDFWESKP